jgi:hypothetical protein
MTARELQRQFEQPCPWRCPVLAPSSASRSQAPEANLVHRMMSKLTSPCSPPINGRRSVVNIPRTEPERFNAIVVRVPYQRRLSLNCSSGRLPKWISCFSRQPARAFIPSVSGIDVDARSLWRWRCKFNTTFVRSGTLEFALRLRCRGRLEPTGLPSAPPTQCRDRRHLTRRRVTSSIHEH